MNLKRFIAPVALMISVLANPTAHALELRKIIKGDALPANWRHLLSFVQPGKAGASGKIFLGVSTNENTGVMRIESLNVLYDRKSPSGQQNYLQRYAFNIEELKTEQIIYDKPKVKKPKKPKDPKDYWKIISIHSPQITDQGGTINLTILSDGTNQIYSPWKTTKFDVRIENNEIVAERDGDKKFNIMKFTARELPFLGEVGIKRVEFCKDSCESGKLNDQDFVL